MGSQRVDLKMLRQKAIQSGNKDIISRIGQFHRWVEENQLQHLPAQMLVEKYAYFLRERLSPLSVSFHLSSILSRLDEMGVKCHRDFLEPLKKSTLTNQLLDKSTDDGRLRLNEAQITHLLALPQTNTLKGLRDYAILALMLATGVREAEVVMLDTHHLAQEYNGMLALHVPAALGCSERLIPYGEMAWVLDVVQAWCRQAGIENGTVFRGVMRGGKKVRPNRLTTRAVTNILAEYPLTIDGEEVIVKALDLRRTYATQRYKSGVNLSTLKTYLGLTRTDAVVEYIGDLDRYPLLPEFS